MRERRATGYCERCAQRLDLLIPEPGSTDVELARVEYLIRFCAGCGRYVGRACCWRAEDGACADCAARAASAKANGETANDAVASGAMRILAEAPTELAEVEEHAAASAAAADRDRALDAWEDAWLEAGALSARVESAGRAAAQRAAASAPAAGAGDEPRRQLRRLVEASTARREAAVRALSQAGALIASRFEEHGGPAVRALSQAGTRIASRLEERGTRTGARRAPATPGHPVPLLASVVVIALLVAVGVAAVGELQRLGSVPAPTDAPGRSPLAAGASGPSPTGVTGVQTVAEAAFDLRVLGSLTVESPIVHVEGSAHVLAFPTSFDRSVRLTGPGVAGLCVDGSTVRDGPTTVALDLMRAAEAVPAALVVTFAAPSQTRESFEAGPELMSELDPGQWFRLTMTHDQGGTALAEIQLRDGGDEIPDPRLQPAPEPVTVDDETICVWLLADSEDHSILLDNLSITQP